MDVEIPLNETQLHDPFVNLRDLLEPYVRVLDHLPSNWGDVPDFTIDAIQGDGVNLVSPSEDSADPWPGFTTGTRAQPVESPAQAPITTPQATAVPDMGIITPPGQ